MTIAIIAIVITQLHDYILFIETQSRDRLKRNDKHMTRKSNATMQFPVVLKTIHNDILRDNKNATIDTKKMRVKLRAKPPFDHDANAAWVALNAKQYDAIRSMFDASYASRIAKPARVRKSRVVATNVDATIDA